MSNPKGPISISDCSIDAAGKFHTAFITEKFKAAQTFLLFINTSPLFGLKIEINVRNIQFIHNLRNTYNIKLETQHFGNFLFGKS